MYIIETGVPQRKSASYAPGRAPRAKLVPPRFLYAGYVPGGLCVWRPSSQPKPHDWVVVDGWVPRGH